MQAMLRRLVISRVARPMVRRQFAIGKFKDFIVKAWKDTYPDENSHAKSFQSKIEKTKLQAQKEREERERVANMSEEELAEYEKLIPDYKKGALVFVKQNEADEPLSKRIKRKIYQYVKESAVAAELKKNDVDIKDFEEELDRLAEGGKIFKENVKGKFTDSDNKIIQKNVNLGSTNAAVAKMRQIDPEFDIMTLEDDAKEIFTSLFRAFLKGDIEYIEKVASGEALGYFQATLKSYEIMEVKPLMQDIWCLDSVHLNVFNFTVSMQELDCLVSTVESATTEETPTVQNTLVKEESKKDSQKKPEEKKAEDKKEGEEETHDHSEETSHDGKPKYVPHGKLKGEVVQGDKSTVVSNQYMMTLQLHDEPDIESVGHAWKITSFRLAQKLKMLV